MNKNMQKGLLVLTLLSMVAPAMAIWPFTSKSTRQVGIEQLQPVRKKTCEDTLRNVIMATGVMTLLYPKLDIADAFVGAYFLLTVLSWHKESGTARRQLQTQENPEQMQATPATGLSDTEHEVMSQE